VIDEFGFISIDVQELERLPMKNMDEPSVRLRSTDHFYEQQKLLEVDSSAEIIHNQG